VDGSSDRSSSPLAKSGGLTDAMRVPPERSATVLPSASLGRRAAERRDVPLRRGNESLGRRDHNAVLAIPAVQETMKSWGQAFDAASSRALPACPKQREVPLR
jgi:hypothetical protein